MRNIRDLLFALVIFSGILIGLTSFYADLFSRYDKSVQDISDYGMTDQIETHVNTLKTSIEDTQITGITLIDIPLTIARGVYNTFRLLFTSVDLYLGLLRNLSDILPVPSWFTAGVLMGCLSIFIVFEIISAIAKYKV